VSERNPQELLRLFHGMLARSTEGVWHRQAEEAERTLAQAHEVLEELKPQVDEELYARLLNDWINAAQLVEHVGDYGPDQERPR
jgi:hypothetical protein